MRRRHGVLDPTNETSDRPLSIRAALKVVISSREHSNPVPHSFAAQVRQDQRDALSMQVDVPPAIEKGTPGQTCAAARPSSARAGEGTHSPPTTWHYTTATANNATATATTTTNRHHYHHHHHRPTTTS